MLCYNAVIADARMSSATDLQARCSILSPELALPSGSHATTTRSHGALHILGNPATQALSSSTVLLFLKYRYGDVLVEILPCQIRITKAMLRTILGGLLRLFGYPGSHARAEDGCSQCRGRNPGSDEGLFQGRL